MTVRGVSFSGVIKMRCGYLPFHSRLRPRGLPLRYSVSTVRGQRYANERPGCDQGSCLAHFKSQLNNRDAAKKNKTTHLNKIIVLFFAANT